MALVHLRTSREVNQKPQPQNWVAIGSERRHLDYLESSPPIGDEMEAAFEAIREDWVSLAHDLSFTSGATLAHAPACAPNVSDMGCMMAWSRLVDHWIAENRSIGVLCDDPWMFRHLSEKRGVAAGTPPALAVVEMKLRLRGLMARTRFALSAFVAALAFRDQRRRFPNDKPCLLVYGHPRSHVNGVDAYFGPIMSRFSSLFRVISVDGGIRQARRLTASGRNASLHAWGNPWEALTKLVGAKWRPSHIAKTSRQSWLVKRSVALEGGTGHGAMARWTELCLARWFQTCRPSQVIWPWENHAWERQLVRIARRYHVSTLGYQHSVVGRHMYNYAADSNHDGMKSLPDRVLTTGATTRRELTSWGLPESRSAIGGALRLRGDAKVRWNPAGPVFVALPFDRAIAREMIAAIRVAARAGFLFVVKDHPIYRTSFAETPGIVKTEIAFEDHEKISRVLFSASTVGLEALVFGIPALRYVPAHQFAIDITPENIDVPTTGSDGLSAILASPSKPVRIDRELIFSEPMWDQWRQEIIQGVLQCHPN